MDDFDRHAEQPGGLPTGRETIIPSVLLDRRFRSGGAGRYADQLEAGLTELGEVEVHVSRPRRDTGCHPGRPFTPWGRVSVGALARRLGVTLVHGLHLELPRTDIPSVVTIQDVIPLDHPASMPSLTRQVLYRRVLASSLRRASRVIVPSEATAASLRARGVDAQALAVVPLCADPVFYPSTNEERITARRRFASGRPYVVAATGLKPHKNPSGLAAAAALLQRTRGIEVLASGPPIAAAAPAVRFLGPLPDAELRSLYAGAEVLVLPSHIEGFGLPALEALKCGVPVICGPGVGALPYLRAGVVEVDVLRPQEVAEAVERVLDDGALRERLVEEGTACASLLSRERMARRTLAVYRSVLLSL